MNLDKTNPNKGFYVASNRLNKAKKILSVLLEERNSDLTNCVVLDIGTGNGEIANYLASKTKKVISIDISNNRTEEGEYEYLICNENLPFVNESIDLVISNHVIEHVSDNKLHLKEIHRVLKEDGTVYLATPNRLWPWEVHYKIPLLHYLPKKQFIKLLKLLNLYHEDLDLLSWTQLKRLTKKHFASTVYCDRVTREPNKYSMNLNSYLVRLLSLFPLRFYTFLTFINPTLIITLRKK